MKEKYKNILLFLKEIFYRKEVEIFREGMTNTYGMRTVWRSRIKTPDGVSGWRKYSSRRGDYITMNVKDMLKLIEDARLFVRDMK